MRQSVKSASIAYYIAAHLVAYIFPEGSALTPFGEDNGETDVVGDLLGFTHSFGSLHTLDKLVYWANKEKEIYEVVNDSLVMINTEIEIIVRYLEDYEESSGKALEHSIKPLTSPEERGKLIGSSAVLGHLMTNRYATTVADLRSFLQSEEYQEIEERLNQALELGEYYDIFRDWPNSEDLYMSHLSLLHIQEVHNFHPEEVYKGLKIDTEFGGEFTAEHSAAIGMFALSTGYFFRAIEWLEHAQNLLEEDDSLDHVISMQLIRSLIYVAIQEHNRQGASDSLGDDSFAMPITMRTYIFPAYPDQPPEHRRSGIEVAYDHVGGTYGNKTHMRLNMYALCSGFEFQPESIRSRMNCYLKRDLHPYFILNPLKVEQLSEYPYVLHLHDVLGNDTIEELHKTRGEMDISSIANRDLKASVGIRTSAGTLLHPELTKKILEKSELITGLRLPRRGIDLPQTVEYVYGRLFFAHKDTLSSGYGEDEGKSSVTFDLLGDRLATLLYYMDEPEAGGLTPLCEVGVAVKPVRGSALFWFNMFKNGTTRGDVSHAACPVLYGRKTIINQWIRYNVNFQTYQCSLDQFQ